jgi:hypothetical protein
MEQKVSYKKVDVDGVTTETVVLSIKDVKYERILADFEMTIADAMELHRLLGNKLGEIPA